MDVECALFRRIDRINRGCANVLDDITFLIGNHWYRPSFEEWCVRGGGSPTTPEEEEECRYYYERDSCGIWRFQFEESCFGEWDISELKDGPDWSVHVENAFNALPRKRLDSVEDFLLIAKFNEDKQNLEKIRINRLGAKSQMVLSSVLGVEFYQDDEFGFVTKKYYDEHRINKYGTLRALESELAELKRYRKDIDKRIQDLEEKIEKLL